MSAFGRADCPRAAVISGLRFRRVVAALAEGAADGMNRRQIDDVESHSAA